MGNRTALNYEGKLYFRTDLYNLLCDIKIEHLKEMYEKLNTLYISTSTFDNAISNVGKFIYTTKNYWIDKYVVFDFIKIKNIKTCDICDKIINNENKSLSENNLSYICDDCFTEHYEKCGHCGKYEYKNNFHKVLLDNKETKMCNDCKNRYRTYRCFKCNVYYIIYSDSDEHLCPDCVKENEVCRRCGGVYSKEEHEIINGICLRCIRTEKKQNAIKNYSYKPTPLFKNSYTELVKEDNFMGLELEFNSDNSLDEAEIALSVIENIDEFEDFAYLKHDGSLNNGFELVTHPISAKAWHEIYLNKLEEAIKRANSYGLKSNNKRCGLHIHYNLSNIGKNLENGETTDDIIAKIIYLMSKNWEFVEKFSRRQESYLYDWAKPYSMSSEIHDCSADNVKHIRRYCNRYHCVNLQNEYTIEFRIFKGTDNIDHVKTALLFVENIIKYCKNHTREEIMNTTNMQKVMMLSNDKTMKDYLIKRGLYNTNQQEDCVVSA